MEILSLKKLENVAFYEPSTLSYNSEEGKTEYVFLSKGVARSIYSNIRLSLQTSNKIFGISREVWKTVIEIVCKDQSKDNKEFDLNNFKFLLLGDGKMVLDITDSQETEEDIMTFMTFLGSHCSHVLETHSFGYKIIIEGDHESDIDEFPVMVVDFDYINGLYRVYTGAYFDEKFVLNSKPVIFESRLSLFLAKAENLEYEMTLTEKLFTGLKESYSEDSSSVSVREVLDIISQSKTEVEVDENTGMVSQVDMLDGQTIVSFLNFFNIPYKALKKMALLRKSLKSDTTTVDDVLRVLSRNLREIGNINGRVVANLLSASLSGSVDSSVVKEELKID